MNFDAFVNDIINNQWKVHGVQVYCDRVLTHSYGDTFKTKYPIYSATKSILSIAVGIACDQGKLNLQRSILDYLPELSNNNTAPSFDNVCKRFSLSSRR